MEAYGKCPKLSTKKIFLGINRMVKRMFSYQEEEENQELSIL